VSNIANRVFGFARATKAKVLMVALASVLVVSPVLPAALAQALSDTTPPTLTNFTLSPATIDTSGGSVFVTFTATMTDDLSGPSQACIDILSPLGDRFFNPCSGNASSDGVATIGQTLPRYSEQGTWTVNSLSLLDKAGNRTTLDRSTLQASGYPTSFQQVGVSDGTAPTLTNFAISPATIDTSSGSAFVTFTATMADDVSGPSQACIDILSPLGDKFFNPCSGNASSDGVATIGQTLPRYSEQGTWSINSLTLIDQAGNRRFLSRSDVEASGYSTTFQQAGVGDNTPPTLTAFTIMPAVIDTSSSSATVLFQATIADDVSGPSQACIDILSPLGDKFFNPCSDIASSAGVATIGLMLPQFSEQGIWNVNSLTVLDKAGNKTTLDRSALQAAGYPISFLNQNLAPVTPTGLAAQQNPTNTAPQLYWAPISGATSYNVYRDGVFVGSTAAASFTDVSLSATGTYNYTVTAVNGSGESAQSAPLAVLYDITPPSVSNVTLNPTTITTGSSTNLTATVTDSVFGTASRAEYFVGSDPGEGNGSPMTFSGSTASAALGSSLASGNYTVSVRAANSLGTWSQPVQAQTALSVITAPSKPTSATATAGNGQATITWTAPTNTGNSAITRYTVTATDVTTAANGGQTATSTSTSATMTGLTGGDVYSFTVTATNNAGTSAPSTPSNQVTILATPSFVNAPSSASTGMRAPFSQTFTTSGYPTASVTQSGNLPFGIIFTDNGDGTATVSGVASAGTSGIYPITLTADNGVGSPAVLQFTLTVTTASSAPQITSDPNDTETATAPFSFTVTTNGYPVPTLSYSGTLPSGGVTFVDNGNGTATISGTPNKNSAGTYTITISATSTAGTVTQTFTLTITSQPVVKTKNIPPAHIGKAYSASITTSGSPTPSLAELGALPTGLTFVDNGNGTATISGTPAAGASGTYTITVTATNSNGSSAPQTYRLSVK
jgi:hypothetical protein